MGFGVRAFVRGKPQMWLAGGSCAPDGPAWTCRPDTDGASTIRLEAVGAALKMDNPGRLKVFDDRTGPGLNTRMIGGEAERTFLLPPAKDAAGACRPLG